MNEQATTTKRKDLVGTRYGTVLTDVRDKTIKVEVSYKTKAPKYGKYVNRRSTFHVHDANNEAKIGDLVEIAPCRPISKTKNWRLVRVVEAAPGSDLV
jgi:small subunit ribosomal protein S17